MEGPEDPAFAGEESRAAGSRSFSVVIPTTGRSQLIEKTLLAIVAQDLLPQAVIIVIREGDTATRERLTAIADELGHALPLRIETVDEPGLVAALNVGLYAVDSDFVAFTDDDAVPSPTWLADLLAVYRNDPSVGGVGGRDVITEHGRLLEARLCSVGKLSWFGRLGSNHHLGMGPAREVDFLKGVNMSYRTDIARTVGFDVRLRGRGCQVANEVSLGLPLRRHGWKLIYDPSITVDHRPATRPPDDDRLSRDLKYLNDAAFNEALLIAEHVTLWRRVVFMIYAFAVGNRRNYGFLQSLRFLPQRGLIVFPEWFATAKGRWAGFRARRGEDVLEHAPRPLRSGPGQVRREDSGRCGLTVVVPTYRREPALRQCLAALASQEQLPDETLVVVRDVDATTRASLEADPPDQALNARLIIVSRPGVVHALQTAAKQVTTDLVAFTDDDAMPWPCWIRKLVRSFEDPQVGGVGGRDWVTEQGITQFGAARTVGVLRSYGKLIGNHHLGVGPARDVDTLKGVNMAFRTPLVQQVGFDARLRGEGAQVANEVALCLPIRAAGWKILYDPSIAVDHHPSVRYGVDKRHVFNYQATREATHNITLPVLEHLPALRRAVFIAWWLLVGTRRFYGLLQLVRFAKAHGGVSLLRFKASMHGRFDAIKAWREGRADHRPVPTGVAENHNAAKRVHCTQEVL